VAATRGLLSDAGTDADQVLGVHTSMLAPRVMSADSPRFLGFIPAAPTKASLLFDMLISCASIQGISWLEAAGAVHAENQVLRLISDRAGLPDTAGGCFVSGGSAANASYPDVIREQGGEWNPTDYAHHLTRRARGLPLWFSLAVHGVLAYTEAVGAPTSGTTRRGGMLSSMSMQTHQTGGEAWRGGHHADRHLQRWRRHHRPDHRKHPN